MDMFTNVSCEPKRIQTKHRLRILVTIFDLKLKLSQYPAIDINYMLCHCTTIIIIIFDTVVRQKRNFKQKNNEFNSVAILILWHASPRLGHFQANVPGMRRR